MYMYLLWHLLENVVIRCIPGWEASPTLVTSLSPLTTQNTATTCTSPLQTIHLHLLTLKSIRTLPTPPPHCKWTAGSSSWKHPFPSLLWHTNSELCDLSTHVKQRCDRTRIMLNQRLKAFHLSLFFFILSLSHYSTTLGL